MGIYASPEADPDDEILEEDECDACGEPLGECVCDDDDDDDDDDDGEYHPGAIGENRY